MSKASRHFFESLTRNCIFYGGPVIPFNFSQMMLLDRKEIHSPVYPLTESLKGSGPMQIL